MTDQHSRVMSLHAPRLPIVGRNRDLDALVRLIDQRDSRLVTITGLGGIGKTRLAVEVAARVVGRHAIVLELAAITDPSYVIPAIAGALELPNAGPEADDEVTVALGRRPTLLVLDNLEQLVGVHAIVESLLATVPGLAILGTSRRPLGLAGERLWRTQPLRVPGDEMVAETGADVDDDGAVQLFRAVAQAVDSRFTVDGVSREHIVAICRRLGGHPLAIELAAARCARLGPAALRRELDRHEGHDARSRRGQGGDRHLESAIGWSYQHLDPEAKVLFHHLAVFESWATFELIEAFTSDLGVAATIDLVGALDTLVDHHLLEVWHDADHSRFRMLPPVRDVALAWVSDRGIHEAGLLAHERCLRQLAATALAAHDEPGGHAWLPVLETARADLSAALDRAITGGRADHAAELGAALAWVWSYRRVFGVHRNQLERAADLVASSGASRRSRVLLHGWRLTLEALSGASAARLHDLDRHAPEPITDAEPDVTDLVRHVLTIRAFTLAHDLDEAWRIGRLALEAVDGRDDAAAARAEAIVGMLASMRGDLDEALRLGRRALDRARRLDDDKDVVRAGILLFPVEHALGWPASITLDEAHAAARRLGDPETLEWLRPMLALEALGRGDVARAARFCADSFAAPPWGGVDTGTVCAAVLVTMCAADRPADAARIHGMLADRRRLIESHLLPSHRAMYAGAIDLVRQRLGAGEFDRLVRQGSSLSWPVAIVELGRLAHELAEGHPGGEPDERSHLSSLTPRELDVLRELAAGGTNKDIAAALGMRSKTVMHHTTSIYRKLGVRRRTEAAALAHRLGLVGGRDAVAATDG
ncbi:MAG: LuxR C-terminal-related transcriptional regulator [Acidimicrobiales bacterium]